MTPQTTPPPDSDHAPIAPGTMIGRYEVLAELGSGGMASVHLARIVGPGTFRKLVALKRIHPHLADRRDVVEMFVDEASLAARITHPNTCSVIDFGEADGTWYMAMEYLEGAPLSSIFEVSPRLLRRNEISWQRHIGFLCRAVIDACKGLHGAHETVDDHGKSLEIVHRDMSPDNVVVTDSGVSKVVDFGIATGRGRIHATKVGIMKGKVGYLAPEVFGTGDVDRRIDIWSLGVLLWEGLCGERLFWSTDPQQTMAAIMTRELQAPSAKWPQIPVALDGVVLKALDRAPKTRWPTAATLGAALERLCQDEELTLSDTEMVEHLDKVLPGHREKLRSSSARALDEKEPSGFRLSRLPFASSLEIELGDIIGEEELLPETRSLQVPEHSAASGTTDVDEAPTAKVDLRAADGPDPEPDAATTEIAEASPRSIHDRQTELQSFPAAAPRSRGSQEASRRARRLLWSTVALAMVVTAFASYWIAGFFGTGQREATSPLAILAPDRATLSPEQLALIRGHAIADSGPQPISRADERPSLDAEPSNDHRDAAAMPVPPPPTGDAAVAVDSGRPTPAARPVADSGLAKARKRGPRPRRVGQAAQKQPQHGSVRIATPGGWAAVYHQGRRVAPQTPTTVRLPAGRQVLELRFGGTQRSTVVVNVRPGESVAVVRRAPR